MKKDITLHLKISCPPSPVHSQKSLAVGDAVSRPPPRRPVPRVSVRAESDCEGVRPPPRTTRQASPG
ncbi:putative electrogenic sodium bicarbonate cotransporter 4-like [Scophthalmus maximus]|uniref:Putative electrogenic sodium bicarbonate cotransporter 4-like n=1 Tax=Scophthalmus maximus TaxID=52904 RepID=A0A2U9B9Z2_SCOMX|nr:putative electrogenic sodium bicarbonate cotransporter 4-like [Scophthalmus maximus]